MMAAVRGKLPWALVAALGLLLLAALAGVVRSGPLDPPAPPGSTLPQVEPRVPIPSLPYTISQEGSYFLTTNLVGSGGGISVHSSNVEIDLNGFTLDGWAGGTVAVSDDGIPSTNIAVRNGAIRTWSDAGIDLGASSGVHISDIRAGNNYGIGIQIGLGIIEDCIVGSRPVDFVGIRAFGTATIANCQVDGYQTGFALNGGGVIRDSVSTNAGLTGIYTTGSSRITGSRVSAVGTPGSGPNNGIIVNGKATVEDNTIDGVGDGAAPDSAISVAGSSNVVTRNAINNAEVAVRLQAGSADTTIYENSLGAATTYLAGSAAASDEIGPERPYDDRGAWDQTLSTTASDVCNSARFRCIMNGEAVLDRETGLVWERDGGTAASTWGDAMNGCYGSTIGGKRGWRLPTIAELLTLSSGASTSLVAPAPFLSIYVSPVPAWYWSASQNTSTSGSVLAVFWGSGMTTVAPTPGYGGGMTLCVRAAESIN